MKIFLIGFMGCGKSYWGKRLGEKLQLPFFDLDEKIEEQQGKTISKIFYEQDEEGFRLIEKDALHLISESHESFVMACGGGTPCFFNNIDYLKSKGTVIWINCSVECLFSRLVTEKEKRPLIRDLSDEALTNYIAKKYASRKIFYQQAQVHLTNDKVSLETLLYHVFHQS